MRQFLTSCVILALAAAPAFSGEEQKKRRPAQRPAMDVEKAFQQWDANKDGSLDRSEVPERLKERFERIDANSDGKLSLDELRKVAPRLGLQPPTAGTTPDALFRLLDSNADGKLSKDELQNAGKLLEKLDKNKDGQLDAEELTTPAPKRKSAGRPGEVITPAAKGERQKDKLNAGDPAPDFTLPTVAGKQTVTLSSFKGQKPVVLIFASYT